MVRSPVNFRATEILNGKKGGIQNIYRAETHRLHIPLDTVSRPKMRFAGEFLMASTDNILVEIPLTDSWDWKSEHYRNSHF